MHLNKLLLFCVHPGRFHVDEILSIALMLRYHPDYRNWDKPLVLNEENNSIEFNFVDSKNTPYTGVIYRSADGEVHKDFRYVIDVGQEYNEDLGLFDHHQWEKGHSACMLIFKYLYGQGFIDETLHDFLFPWIKALSGWDTGETIYEQIDLFNSFKEEHEAKISHLPEIISLYTRKTDDENKLLTQWIKAFNVIWEWVHNLNHKAKGYKKDLKNLKKAQVLGRGNEILVSQKTFISHWREFDRPFIYQIAPGSRKGEYGVTSRDSSRWPLPYPEDTNELVFYHSNKFYASFSSWDAALSYAKKKLSIL